MDIRISTKILLATNETYYRTIIWIEKRLQIFDSPSFRTISPYEAFSYSIFESMAEAIGKGEF